jgi:hypothetical protein
VLARGVPVVGPVLATPLRGLLVLGGRRVGDGSTGKRGVDGGEAVPGSFVLQTSGLSDLVGGLCFEPLLAGVLVGLLGREASVPFPRSLEELGLAQNANVGKEY